ncbi:MAG: hypothetical protein NTZ32_01370 [Planctomycetales bacterium]|nr:hypothetical protein [Planctomycetales bacterium]
MACVVQTIVRSLIGQSAEQLHQLRLGAGIESRRWLIEKVHARSAEQLDANADSFALATTQHPDLHLTAMSQIEGFERVVDDMVQILGIHVRR